MQIFFALVKCNSFLKPALTYIHIESSCNPLFENYKYSFKKFKIACHQLFITDLEIIDHLCFASSDQPQKMNYCSLNTKYVTVSFPAFSRATIILFALTKANMFFINVL